MDYIIEEIWQYGDEERIPLLERVLQTQSGGYGYGDLLCGTRVPILRRIAKKYTDISLEDAESLLQDDLHEARFVALVILINKFKIQSKEIFDIYLRNTAYVNNWDLVDISAPHIIGNYCLKNGSSMQIWGLAKSNDLWENRMAIISSWAFTKTGSYDLTLELCQHFFCHNHHLIHRAIGWMLREIGKKDTAILVKFLEKHQNNLPRITLSYACERLKKPDARF
jgi:3-methyladenine DNA glycosylase AlkD